MNKNGEFEVVSPWAEADPVPLTGITARPKELKGKTIGLLVNGKVAAAPVQAVVETKLKERFPDATFTRFTTPEGVEVVETENKGRFGEWVKGVDAVVGAVGD